MKRIHSLILVAMCMIMATGSAFAISPAVRGAQMAVKNYLTKQGYTSQIDDKDNSVNFRFNNSLFYVTFEETGSGILYTLHRTAIKFEQGPSDANARRLENATVAANYLNGHYPYKTYVNGNRVDFVYPVFATSPEDYIKAFPTLLKSMTNIKENFDRYYKVAKTRNDSIHQFWARNDTSVIVVPQQKVQGANTPPSLTVSGVPDFRIIDANGAVLTNYGESIRKSELKYIQPSITLTATKKGTYHIGVVIIAPNGKTLVPNMRDNRTIITTKEIDKKPTTVELDSFGSPDGKFWEAGEYKVIFYEGNNILKETSFNVL